MNVRASETRTDRPLFSFSFPFFRVFLFLLILSKSSSLFLSLSQKKKKQPALQRPRRRRALHLPAPAFPFAREDGREVVEVFTHGQGSLERDAAAAPNGGNGSRCSFRGSSSATTTAAAAPLPPALPSARARKGPQVQEALPHQRAPVPRSEGRGEASDAFFGDACSSGSGSSGSSSPLDAAAALEGRVRLPRRR